MQNLREEISFRDLVFNLKRWLTYLKHKWVIILILGFVGGVIGFVFAYLAKPKYTADLTFVLASNNKTNTLSSLAGQFGFDLGGNTDDLFSGDNIIELFDSKRILRGALFRKITHRKTTLLNLLIEKTELDKGWKKNKHLSSSIPFPDSAENMTPIQDSLLSELHDLIVKNYLIVDKPDKKLSIYQASVTSPDEEISYYLTKYILAEASNFYIEIKTQMAKQNLGMLQHEADSLKTLLGNSITSTAEASDNTFNLNPAYQVQRSNTQQGQARVTVLGTAYGEVVKNLELAKINLQKETPLFQVIDEPTMPLIKISQGKLKTAVLVSLLFVSIYIAIITLKKIYANLMEQSPDAKIKE
jgi:hypothetical protein